MKRTTGSGSSIRDERPSEVVRRAYLAANRGRFADANRWVTPVMLTSLAASRTHFVRAVRDIRKQLRQVADAKTRRQMQELLTQARWLADRHLCWKSTTRNRSIAKLTVTREVRRGNQAKVYLTLRLKNGKSAQESEHLVWTKGRWLIG